MKILVVYSCPLFPTINGSQKVVIEYCRILEECGCDVWFLGIGNKDYIETSEIFGRRFFLYKPALLKIILSRALGLIKEKITRYNWLDERYPWGLTSYVNSLHKKYHFDACIVNYITLSRLLMHTKIKRKIIYTHDVFSFKKERLNLQEFWFDLLPNQEACAVRRSTDILSIQSSETVYYSYLHPNANIYTVYTPIAVKPQPLTKNNSILFLSGTNNLNINGLLFFLEEVYPLIVKENENVNLLIGGAICSQINIKENKNIRLIGTLDNTDDFYKMADIVINPIYQGTGLKVKTIEALSYGKVVVAHPHSADGIYDRDNAPLLIGNTPICFANNVLRAISDIDFRKEISNQSIKYIERMNEYIKKEYKKLIATL